MLRLFNNVMLMMQRRGYEVAFLQNEDQLNNLAMSNRLTNPQVIHRYIFEEFKSKNISIASDTRLPLSVVLSRGGENTVIFFAPHMGDKLGKDTGLFGPRGPGKDAVRLFNGTINSFFESFPQEIKSGIMIGEMDMTPPGRKLFEEQSKEPDMNIQYFTDDEVLYDPTDSVYTSKVTGFYFGESRDAFLQENNLVLSHMARINASDPIAKYYGLPPGTIVKLFRSSFLED